jgi:hypothetical protein
VRQLFVGTLSSAENLENQLEDSVNYLLAQTVLFEESENVADKLQESLKKLCRFLAARLKLRKKLDYLVNERCDEFHYFCLLFIFTGINKILTYFICKSNSQIGKNTAVQAQFFVTLLMYKNIYIEKYQSLSA